RDQSMPARGKIEHREIRRLRQGGLRQADLEHDRERREEKSQKPKIRHKQNEPRAPWLPGLVAGGHAHHSFSNTAAPSGHHSHTLSPAAIGRSSPRAALGTAAFITEPSASRTL